MSEQYDIADPNDPNTLRIPFMFVPHGCEPTPEWLQAHPGAIKIPAVMVPRDPRPGEAGPQWNVQLDFPDQPASTAPMLAAPPPADTAAPLPVDPPAPAGMSKYEAYVTGGCDPVAVWRWLKTVFDDPARAAGIVVSVADTTTTSGMSGVPANADPAPRATAPPAADTREDTKQDANVIPSAPAQAQPNAWPGVEVRLPDGSRIPDPHSPTGYVMSRVPDLAGVAEAGRLAGAAYFALAKEPMTAADAVVNLIVTLGVNLGHAGTFDYQRSGTFITGYTQFPQFRSVPTSTSASSRSRRG